MGGVVRRGLGGRVHDGTRVVGTEVRRANPAQPLVDSDAATRHRLPACLRDVEISSTVTCPVPPSPPANH